MMISNMTLKTLLISTAVFSAAVILKLCVPLIMEFTVSDLPLIWTLILTCLKPPYLYLTINCIIITIVASSKLHSRTPHGFGVNDTLVSVRPEAVKVSPVFPQEDFGYEEFLSAAKAVDDFPVDYPVMRAEISTRDLATNVDARILEAEDVTTVNVSGETNGKDEIVISRFSLTPVRRAAAEQSFSSSSSSYKPPCSARFGHRKPVKASPEVARTLGVSKSKRHETLETTWKTITDGRPMPLNRHLRKSDTWENNAPRHHPEIEHDQKMAKSETFNDRSTATKNNRSQLSPSLGSGKLRKEPSLSQDDLNRRVEAFINKFNEDMRIQRQESLNQYMEMINRGAHH